MSLETISKEIANLVGMPYAWEDVFNRLKSGRALPFEINDEPPTVAIKDHVCVGAIYCIHYMAPMKHV